MASNGISCTDFFADSNFLTLYDSVKNVLKKENNAYIAVMTTLHLRGNITLVFWFSDRQEQWSGTDVYLINVTADQPEIGKQHCSVARGGV